jgi:uncharacterized membrane protein
MDVDISLSKNDIVKESISIGFMAEEQYDSVEFTSVIKPLTVYYQGEYSIREEDDNYVITLDKEIKKGKNSLKFVLIYDSIVEGNGNNKVFRTRFYPENAEDMKISLTLPTYYILSDKEPSVTPKPDSITTDGQRIKLEWEFKEQADIVVFYESQTGVGLQIIPFVILVVVISVSIYFYFKKKTKTHISEVLTSEEKKVVAEIRKGVTKQKEIARNLEFSKSKMSKVIRKLEEKNLIEKKPYFKTNIIKLSKKIK